jgi:hypothetical protein
MNWRDIVIGLLVFFALVQWGNHRLLEARFEHYLQSHHLKDARDLCTKVARSEFEAASHKPEDWHFVRVSFGIGPDSWPWEYFKWGQFWELHNASATLIYVVEDRTAGLSLACDYSPIGAGSARIR